MLTVIVPVYNEEEILVENTLNLIKYLDTLEGPYEIVICSNGSTDDTDRLGKKLESDFSGKVRFFSIPNRGVGRAFKKAVFEANYDNLISIDVDLTTDIKFIAESVKLLDKYDIVIGSKKLGDQKRSIPRLFISSGFILLVKLFLGMGFSDYSIGTKAYKKKVIIDWVEKIDHGSSYVIELVYRAKKSGHPIIEIPVFCDDRRKSRFNIYSEIFYRFKNLLRLWFTVRVKRT